MDLLIRDQLFVVGGASSGLGKAIAETLANEGARVIAIARGADKLAELTNRFPKNVEQVVCDITAPGSPQIILEAIGSRSLQGVVLNAGGPPAKAAMETALKDWDQAYQTVLRWKVDLLQQLIPVMITESYGRVLFIESASVKQPIENLVLSNAFRLAAVGYAKTLSQEIARQGVTINILAPGYHQTGAMDRIYQKKQETSGISKDEATEEFVRNTAVGFIGNATDFASLASWLLSPHSRYITGQTISVDGGTIKGIMG